MNWFYLALIAPAIWAATYIIDDNLMKKVFRNPFAATIIAGLFALLPLFGLLFVKINPPSTNIILIALLSGFLLVCSSWFYFESLTKEFPSVTVTIWNLSYMLVPLLAFFFLNESLKFSQYVGFVIVLISSIGISLIGIEKFKFSKALPLMTISAIILAIVAILSKYIYNQVSFWDGFVFVSLGMALGSLFFAVVFKKGRQFIKEFNLKYKKYLWIFFIAETMNISAVFLSNLAISKGPISLVKIIEGTQPIFVLLYATVLYVFSPSHFREGLHGNKMKKFVLMGIMILGLYLINQ